MKHTRADYLCIMLIDYFGVLGLGPTATPAEIKSAYRQLVLQHHPDLNPNDPQSADRFRAINEAYLTLTRPQLRVAYLEKRWYEQYRNQPLESNPLTLDRVLRESIELERFIDLLDPHRMDKAGWHQHLQQRIQSWKQVTLDPTSEETIQHILRSLIKCAAKLEIEQAESLQESMKTWLRSQRLSHLLNEEWLIKKRRFDQWQRRTPWIVLLFTILISIVIWLAAR